MGLIQRLAHQTTEVLKSPLYKAKMVGSDALAHEGIKVSTVGVQNAANQMGGIASGLGGSIMVLGAMGAATAFSAGISQMEYKHEREELKEMYKEELSAIHQKPEKKLGDKDLQEVATKNSTIGNFVQKLKKQRNLGIALSVVASLASLALVGAASGMFAEGLIGHVGKAIAGLLTYNVVRRPLQYLGNKMFHLDKETAHERILSMKKDREAGKTLTREQVFSAFVAATPQLDSFITEKYGKQFDQLEVAEKLRITESVGQQINIDELTNSLNLGQINITELAFAVDGQASGVAPKDDTSPVKHGLMNTIKRKLSHLVDHITHRGELPTARETVVMEYHNEPAKKSFVERLGLSRNDPRLGHAERVEQSRSDLPPEVTIH